jgi:3-hydroxy-9,10-secoandrosta-1,3,5(10)-triene-9,17-dione monooxygenase
MSNIPLSTLSNVTGGRPPEGVADRKYREYEERAYQVGAEYLAAIDKVIDVIRKEQKHSETKGSVSPRSVAAMTEAGVFRAVTPMQYGGLEMAPAAFYEGIIKIAEADASAAWIGGQLNVHAFEIALMDKRMQDEFWADGPDTRASSSYAPTGKWEKVDGGYRLNGTWGFSSGVDHATWVILGGGDRNFVVPIDDVEVDQNSWDVSGLKGTGSKAVTLKNVFVPDYRTHVLMDTYLAQNPGWEVNDRPLYRVSFSAIFNSVMANSAIGMTLGGLNAFIEETKTRRARRGTGKPVVENPYLYTRLANALTMVLGARDRHLNNWKNLFSIACEGREATPLERMKVRFEAADAIDTCVRAMQEIWPVAGAGAILSTNYLQQVYRDLLATRVHGAAGWDAAASLYSRALLGLPGPSFEDEPNMRTLAYHR